VTKKHAGLGQPTYDYILHMIMTKQLQPGERIPEQKIAQEFGISRTPVRDAIRQLANDGLIEIYPNRFAQVSQYSDENIRDIGVLRIALDTMAVRLASLFGSQADFLQLRDIAQNCYNAIQEGNGELRRQYDSDFHMHLATISGNELLRKFQNELYLRMQFIIIHYPNTVENERRHIEQHFQIADALIQHDEIKCIEITHDEIKCIEITIDHLTSFYNLREKFPVDFFNNHLLSPGVLSSLSSQG